MRAFLDRGPSTSEYGEYLTMQLALHAPLEAALPRWLSGDWIELRLQKSDWLRTDLRALGRDFDAEVRHSPRVDSWAAAMGVLYVLEGSTLGLQVVRRALHASHPGLRDAGRFLLGYGPDTGRRWRAFLEGFEAVPEDEWPEAIDAARAAFGWFLAAFTWTDAGPWTAASTPWALNGPPMAESGR